VNYYYRVVKMNVLFFCYAYFYARWQLSRIKKPHVTIFGGRHTQKDTEYFKFAHTTAKRLVSIGASIITGGGPGIMYAALCGAIAAQKSYSAIGFGVTGLDVEYTESCGAPTIFLPSYGLRKWFLIQYSEAFIIFPGGIGTLDEFMEILNLMKIKKMKKKSIILFGKAHWYEIDVWIRKAVEQYYVAADIADYYEITDDIEYLIAVTQKSIATNK